MEGSFEDEEEDLFRDELGFFDEELEDDGSLFEEMFANDDMIRGQNMPSTSLGDPKALPNNVPAIREASSIKKNVLEENNQMKLSEKGLPITK